MNSFNSDDRYSYVNDSLGHKSLIDHCFVSKNVYNCINKLDIFDSRCNFSGHRALVGSFNISFNVAETDTKVRTVLGNHQMFLYDGIRAISMNIMLSVVKS